MMIVVGWLVGRSVAERANVAKRPGLVELIPRLSMPSGADITLRNTLQDPGEPELAFPAPLWGARRRLRPEPSSSAWADATIRDVLDMRVGIAYDEDYTDPESDVWRFLQCTGMVPARPGSEAVSVAEVLPSFVKQGEHGEVISYQRPKGRSAR